MTTQAIKRDAVARRARLLYERLMRLPRPADLSNNEWAKRAGVNTSFFTNLRNGSEPSVGNLSAVLETVGVTLPEFFVGNSKEPTARLPDQQALSEAIFLALPGLPENPERQAEYLAEVVLGVLALPKELEAKPADLSVQRGETSKSEHAPGSTKQVAPARRRIA